MQIRDSVDDVRVFSEVSKVLCYLLGEKWVSDRKVVLFFQIVIIFGIVGQRFPHVYLSPEPPFPIYKNPIVRLKQK